MQPFTISLLGLIAGSVVVGAIAQKKKGRTGAGWAALTFAVGVAWYLFFEIALTLAGSSGDELRAAWEELKDTLAMRALLARHRTPTTISEVLGAPWFLWVGVAPLIADRCSDFISPVARLAGPFDF